MHHGYRWEMRHEGDDPGPACVAEVPRAELAAELTRLRPMVERRDHISTMWSRFLERCLEKK